MTDATELAELYMDTTCRAAFPRSKPRLRFTGEPVIVREPRPCWHENVEARVRYALKYMPPETRTVIEGVTVQLYSATMGYKLRYAVAGKPVADFEAAVAAVVAAAGRGGE